MGTLKSMLKSTLYVLAIPLFNAFMLNLSNKHLCPRLIIWVAGFLSYFVMSKILNKIKI